MPCWAMRRRGAALDVLVFLGAVIFAAVLLLPLIQRPAMRGKGEVLRGDLAAIRRAVAEVAIAADAKPGEVMSFERYAPHLRERESLKESGLDPLGNAYGDQRVDAVPAVPPASYGRLRGLVPDSFWAPYVIPEAEEDGVEDAGEEAEEEGD